MATPDAVGVVEEHQLVAMIAVEDFHASVAFG
jgi:hypothetical protein